jgi:hypothetical protein
MNPQQIMRTGITASAIAHLSALTLVLLFSEVHPFGSVTAEPIAVDLVSPAEVVQASEKVEPLPPPKPKAADTFDLSAKPAALNSPAPAASQPPAAPPQKQAALSPQQPDLQASVALPQPPATPAAALPATLPAALPATSPATSPVPAIIPAAPDLSIKYHVLLGLPQDHLGEKTGDGIDAMASTKADIGTSLVTEFRRHLRTCSTLPKSIAPSDSVKLKLRVFMTPDGRLATDPVLLEASASAKGPLLMQSAIDALQACQPYAMLPADRYREWRVLDLGFTPQDFTGG